MSDRELIAACLSNSRKAQEQLYRKYAKTMFHVCLSYCADRDQAKDILQEAFIKAFRKLDTFATANSFEGWLRRIVVNTALDHLRKSKKWSFITIEEQVAEPEDTADVPAFPYSTGKVLRLIGELPPGARAVFNLYALDELSHKEIAGRLKISEGTSKSQYNRARALLRRWLKEEEEQ
ncbi:RNA polymerase sigma factor [Anseongella ginsenosidimutans]|nr:RNA polymerase sigma factor [Anseongella ginsenosidimutans]